MGAGPARDPQSRAPIPLPTPPPPATLHNRSRHEHPVPNATDDLSISLLRRLTEAPQASQRELARDTGVSLGKLNYALRALIDKGWVKAGNFSRNPHKLGYVYLLTPAGIEAKTRLTHAFLNRKLREYDRLRAEIAALQGEVAKATDCEKGSDA